MPGEPGEDSGGPGGEPVEGQAGGGAEGEARGTARREQLEEENRSLKDQLLRAAAEFENFRKRMFREKEEGIRYANSALLADLITTIDDFERAIQSAEVSRDFDSFLAGVTMIERQLVSMLERNWGLKRFQSAGEEFDPDRHQAIMVEAVPGQERTVVVEDYQKGYLLHDRVLRPAKVKVAQPALTGTNGGNEADSGTSGQDES